MSSNSSRLLPPVSRASWSTTNCIDGISRMFWKLKWISAPFSSAFFKFIPRFSPFLPLIRVCFVDFEGAHRNGGAHITSRIRSPGTKAPNSTRIPTMQSIGHHLPKDIRLNEDVHHGVMFQRLDLLSSLVFPFWIHVGGVNGSAGRGSLSLLFFSCTMITIISYSGNP